MQYKVELTGKPSLLSLYRKIFFVRKPGWDGKALPSILVTQSNVKVSHRRAKRYSEVCGFEFDGQILPPTYLHIVMFRLHATLFTHEAITFPLLGLIHLRNQITHYRNVTIDESITCSCELVESEVTDKGIEFVFYSKALVEKELVWESRSTYLYRNEEKHRARPPRANNIAWGNATTTDIPEDLGRRYASASGDYNLIHLYPFLSKRFGFDKVLVHGMWSKAFCLSQLMSKLESSAFSIDVAFKLPVFMPGSVTFNYETKENGLSFEMRDKKGKRPHLTGDLTYL
ncbi:dehydratase [Parashewanella curva]|uniref:Dehydratase n=1 Tax=Parashewanella curva TaxID=2338552 RepID=A0A3L8PYR2_9GAMM|nr:MaoC/PaaZ C-terminal domain-containing protein [Parashewanella curva]RLV60596.1 dehydratase [Parashewanella curva]